VSIRLLSTSDWHLQERAWRRHPDLAGDAVFSLKQIVDRAVEEKVDAVIGAGDLIDTVDPTPSIQVQAHEQFDRLQEAGIPFYFIQGQHERNAVRARFDAHPWPRHFHRRLVTIGGLKMYGLDWQASHQLLTELEEAADLQIGLFVCHQVWGGPDFMGTLPGVEGQLEDCPAPVVLTGDLHQHKTVKLKREDGSTLRVFSPGSTCMQSIDEPPEKAFWELEFNRNKLVDYKSVKLITRPFHTFSLDDIGGLDDLCEDAKEGNFYDDDIPEVVRTPIIHVDYPDNLPDVYDRLMTAFDNQAHVFLSPRPTGSKVVRIEKTKDRVGQRTSLLSFLERATPKGSDEYRLCRRLLEIAESKNAVLDELKKIQTEVITTVDEEEEEDDES
jgi:predicted phosphodiesterase